MCMEFIVGYLSEDRETNVVPTEKGKDSEKLK